MTYRQRNIPVTSKEESESQTDIRLLQSYFLDVNKQEKQPRPQQSTIKLTEVYGSAGLLRPFADHHLLQEFSKGVQELKDLPYDEKIFGKRLQILQKQIGGLLKRDFLVYGASEGSQAWNSYYSTLNQKEKEVIRLEREKIYSDLRVIRLEERIQALQQEMEQLQGSLIQSQKALEENKLYASFYDKIKQIISTSSNKGADMEQVFSEQILPAQSEFAFNLNALSKVINKETPINIRPVVLSLAKEFDKLLKDQQFGEDKLSETVGALINNLKAIRGVDYLKRQFDLARKGEAAQTNYRNILSLFTHEIVRLKADHPNLKGSEKLDWLLRKLEDQKVDLIPINGWMNLAVTNIRVHNLAKEDQQGQKEYQKDQKLRELVGILAGEFNRVYLKFPELKNHCSAQVIEIFQSEILKELIEGGSIERLKEIIVHQVETVRVNDMYTYENTKEKKLIFHLRVLIKSLLEQLYRIKDRHKIDLALDEAILNLLKEQSIDGLNADEVIGLFRGPARYIEVPIVIENIKTETKTFEKGVPIHKSNPIVIPQEKLQVVTINREVPVFIEKPVEIILTNQVPVQVTTEKMVEVAIHRDVIVDRIVETCREVPVVSEKVVTLYQRQEIVREIEIDKVVKDIEIKEVQKIVQVKIQEVVEVEKIVEKLVVCNQFKQIIKEVEIKVPVVITKNELIEVQRKIPYVIQKERAVQVRVEVPVEIRVPEIQLVEVCEYRDKPVVKTNTIEKLVYVQLKVEKQIVREVPKEIFIERSHFIKGDREEVIKEVQVFVDKPIIQEVLITKNVEIEKIVPLYITEQVPVINEVHVPIISERVKEIEVEKVKIVTARQEVVKPITVQKPVPIIVEKEIIKVQPQFIDRIVEKIVQVPRVVEVQKIVQKIVVVPRIIEKIVQVPKIIEKIVICKQQVLQIVEIPIPHVIIQEVEVPIEIIVEKIVVVKQIEVQIVEVEKVIERKVTEQKYVQVQVQKRIPIEIIKEIPVETYRDRIEYQRVEIHETKVQAIEVQVPVIVHEKVPFVVEKEIVTHEIIQELVYEKLIYEKDKIVISKEDRLVVKETIVEKPILIQEAVEVVGPETIVRLMQPVQIEIIREKLVKESHYVETIKEVILQQQKIVTLIHEKIVSVPINELVITPELIEVPKLVNLVHYKQIAVAVPVRETRLETTVVQQIKEIEKNIQVPFQVEISRQKIKQIVREVKSLINRQVVKEIKTQVEVLVPTETQIVQVPGETIIQQLTNEDIKVVTEDRVFEKLIEKIVMLPQIVEVVKNIHHIAEVNQLGVAVDTDINVHTQKFVGVTTELKKALVELLGTFRSNVGRQPDLKNLIGVIEKYLKFIDDWISFPKLVEIPTEVIREVVKQKPVMVPTQNKEREASLYYILQKLLNQLRRIKDSHKIPLSLDEDITRLFFSERRGDQDLDKKFAELQDILKSKYNNFGSWSESHPFLVGSFLQDHLGQQGLVDEANRAQRAQSEEILRLRHDTQIAMNKYNHLLCANRKLLDENSSLIRTLEKSHSSIPAEEFDELIKTHKAFYDDLIQGKIPLVISTIERTSKFGETSIIGERPEQSLISQQKESYIGQLVSKLTKYEAQNQKMLNNSNILESKITQCQDQLHVKDSIIKRMQADFDSKISRAREEFSKSPNVSKDLIEQNKKMLERTRALEKEVSAQKNNADKAKKESERSLESQKRESTRQLERKEKEIKDITEKSKKQFERELNRVNAELQKIKKEKDRLDQELFDIKKRHSDEIRVIRQQQLTGATDKHNQLINENLQLRKKGDRLEADYDKLKKTSTENNSAHEREIQRLKSDIQRTQTEKKSSSQKEGFLDLPQETQLINRNIELEKKIKTMEVDLSKFKSKDESSLGELRSLRERVKNLEIELEIAKKQVETAHKMRETTFQSGYKSGGSSELAVESSLARSPHGAVFKSAEQQGFISPQSVKSEERIEQIGSSSSRFSQELSEPALFKSQMTLRDFMQVKLGDDKEKDVYLTFVMIKVIEAVERNAENGVYNSYSPSNIHLHNFNVKQLDKLNVKFGAPIINKNNKNDGLYLAPEVLGGAISTKKSVVFCLGVILDELIHGAPFFRSMEQIQNLTIEFKVRGEKLNPILKNTLFEMMNKEPSKRLELIEAKRRLSLQKYITAQGRSAATTTQKLQRRREE